MSETERRNYKPISEDIKQFVHEELEAHEAREKQWIEAREKEWIGRLLKAFPNEDVEGHCEYHENKIKAAKAEEEFWQAAKSEALKHGVAGFFAVMRWVFVLAVLGLAYKVGLGPLITKVFGMGP